MTANCLINLSALLANPQNVFKNTTAINQNKKDNIKERRAD